MTLPCCYSQSMVALLTKHGKERVLAPVLEAGLGCSIELVSGFDTDRFGTFTRETARSGTQLEAARRKARKGMELSGLSLGLASEGSFAPDPLTGMLPWNIELLIWIDDERKIEVVGSAQGVATSAHLLTSDWKELVHFAKQHGFPEHQLVLRPEHENDRRIAKDISDWSRLRACFETVVPLSRKGEVFVEVDLRAFANPTRMRIIEEAALDLLHRIQSTCPSCSTPGYWITKRVPGLPCGSCGLPTSNFKSEVWGCLRCAFREEREPKDQRAADPATCLYCNP